MFKRVQALISWVRSHQVRFALIGSVLYGIIKTLDFVRTWLGRRDIAWRSINFLWDIASSPWCLPVAAAAILLYVNWAAIKERFQGKPFEVRTICGETLIAPPDRDVIARLLIKNTSGRPLKGVSVRLNRCCAIHETGFLWGRHTGEFPSIHPDRGESFLLRWASKEPATPDRKFLDIPNDGADRVADCLILVRDDPTGIATFAAAAPDDLKDCQKFVHSKNWFKLDIIVASLCGATQTVELVAGVSDRDPGPISLLPWHPRGEEILEAVRSTHEKVQASRRKEAEQQQAPPMINAENETPPTV